jgi:hypothetical protein
MRSPLLALLFCILFLAACGHPQQDRCEASCAADETCEAASAQCVDSCLSRTEGLEDACAACVAEQFEVESVCSGGGPGNGDEGSCSCSVEQGGISSEACLSFCAPSE